MNFISLQRIFSIRLM